MFGLTWVSAEGQCRVYVSCVWGGFGVYVFCVFVISSVLKNQCLAMADSPRFERR